MLKLLHLQIYCLNIRNSSSKNNSNTIFHPKMYGRDPILSMKYLLSLLGWAAWHRYLRFHCLKKKKLEFCYTHVNNHNKRPSCNSFNTLLCRNPSPRFLAPSDPILFTFFHIHNHEIIPFKRCSHDFLQIRFNEIKAVLTFRASPNSDAPSSLISFTELYTQ